MPMTARAPATAHPPEHPPGCVNWESVLELLPTCADEFVSCASELCGDLCVPLDAATITEVLSRTLNLDVTAAVTASAKALWRCYLQNGRQQHVPPEFSADAKFIQPEDLEAVFRSVARYLTTYRAVEAADLSDPKFFDFPDFQNLLRQFDRMGLVGAADPWEAFQDAGAKDIGGLRLVDLPSLATWCSTVTMVVPSSQTDVWVVLAPGALVREGESLQSPPVGDQLPFGTEVTVKEIRGRRARIVDPVAGWVSLRTAEGESIFEKKAVLKKRPETPPPPTQSSRSPDAAVSMISLATTTTMSISPRPAWQTTTATTATSFAEEASTCVEFWEVDDCDGDSTKPTPVAQREREGSCSPPRGNVPVPTFSHVSTDSPTHDSPRQAAQSDASLHPTSFHVDRTTDSDTAPSRGQTQRRSHSASSATASSRHYTRPTQNVCARLKDPKSGEVMMNKYPWKFEHRVALESTPTEDARKDERQGKPSSPKSLRFIFGKPVEKKKVSNACFKSATTRDFYARKDPTPELGPGAYTPDLDQVMQHSAVAKDKVPFGGSTTRDVIRCLTGGKVMSSGAALVRRDTQSPARASAGRPTKGYMQPLRKESSTTRPSEENIPADIHSNFKETVKKPSDSAWAKSTTPRCPWMGTRDEPVSSKNRGASPRPRPRADPPGPGSYQIPSTFDHKPVRSLKPGFGSSSKRSIDPKVDEGPGAYYEL